MGGERARLLSKRIALCTLRLRSTSRGLPQLTQNITVDVRDALVPDLSEEVDTCRLEIVIADVLADVEAVGLWQLCLCELALLLLEEEEGVAMVGRALLWMGRNVGEELVARFDSDGCRRCGDRDVGAACEMTERSARSRVRQHAADRKECAHRPVALSLEGLAFRVR